MIFTRKHIVIAVLFAVVGIAIGMGIKHYETLQTFSSSDIKVVLDAGHGACGKCFKVPKMSILSHFCTTIDAGEGR